MDNKSGLNFMKVQDCFVFWGEKRFSVLAKIKGESVQNKRIITTLRLRKRVKQEYMHMCISIPYNFFLF